jgi:hypothetical protein
MSQIPDTITRFFTPEGQLRTIPAKAAPREAVLTWIAAQIITPGESLDEVTLNLRLRQFHEDVAMLRRYMIDARLLLRDPSGRNYRAPEASSAEQLSQ